MLLIAVSGQAQGNAGLIIAQQPENWKQRRELRQQETEDLILLLRLKQQAVRDEVILRRWREFWKVQEFFTADVYREYGQPKILGNTPGLVPAVVRYRNLDTDYEAEYSVKVQIINGKVKQIRFDNGGSIHDGPNNSNYLFNCVKAEGLSYIITVLYSSGDYVRFYVPLQPGID